MGRRGICTNARTTGVGKDHTAKVLKSLELSIALNGGANLLGTRSDSEDGLGLDTVVHGVLSDGSGARHVLVRGVCARTNQTDLEVRRPVVVGDGLLELADRGGKIWGEGTVDVRLELREVDLDQLVVFCTLVFTKLLGVRASKVTNLLALGSCKVVVHAVIEGEDGGRGTDFSCGVMLVESR